MAPSKEHKRVAWQSLGDPYGNPGGSGDLESTRGNLGRLFHFARKKIVKDNLAICSRFVRECSRVATNRNPFGQLVEGKDKVEETAGHVIATKVLMVEGRWDWKNRVSNSTER